MDELDKMRKLDEAIAQTNGKSCPHRRNGNILTCKKCKAKKETFKKGDEIVFTEKSGYRDGTKGVYLDSPSSPFYVRVTTRDGFTRTHHISEIRKAPKG